MVVIDGGTATDRVRDALTLFAMIEDRYAGRHAGYSASSGLLVTGHDTGELLAELRGQLDSAGMRHAIGVDVAAEHLRSPAGRYRFEGAELPGADLAERLEAQVRRYGIGYLEDPFDAADEDLWRELTRRLNGVADVVGDDLFATDAERLRPGLAHAIVVKMTQIGTVSGTLTAAARARRLGMSGCVSHRSGETEDTAMCDLAVGLGARYIKVGGPRRGDRTAKYNQLLRLGEAL
jgi:enolase